MNRHLKSLIMYYTALAEEALANLELYFTKPVGVGEHSDIQSELRKWTERLADARSNLDMLQTYIKEDGTVIEVNTNVIFDNSTYYK